MEPNIHGVRVGKRPRCAACRWWFDGACHKRAPLIVSGQLPGNYGRVGVWPETPSDSWCGDFAFGQDV